MNTPTTYRTLDSLSAYLAAQMCPLRSEVGCMRELIRIKEVPPDIGMQWLHGPIIACCNCTVRPPFVSLLYGGRLNMCASRMRDVFSSENWVSRRNESRFAESRRLVFHRKTHAFRCGGTSGRYSIRFCCDFY